MHLPSNTINLKDSAINPKLLVGIIGEPGTGKTYAAATFPNPYFVDLDGSLTKLAMEKRDISCLPLHSYDFCMSAKIPFEDVGQTTKFRIFNKRDWFYNWMKNEGPKFEADQTLVIDSLSSWEVAYNQWTDPDIHPRYSKKGEVDDFYFWTFKIDYFTAVMEFLKGLKCNVVITMHEAKNVSEGQILSTIQPVLQTKFVAKLPSYFDEYLRQLCKFPVQQGESGVAPTKQMTDDLGQINQPTYIWQVKPNNLFTAKSRCGRKETYIRANYKELTYT